MVRVYIQRKRRYIKRIRERFMKIIKFGYKKKLYDWTNFVDWFGVVGGEARNL